jgi:hypothetical protein
MDEIGATQCNGNYAGPPYPDAGWAAVTSTDFGMMKSVYGSTYGNPDPLKPDYDPCADANRDGYVTSTDFGALKSHYGDDPVAGGCENAGASTWPPF